MTDKPPTSNWDDPRNVRWRREAVERLRAHRRIEFLTKRWEGRQKHGSRVVKMRSFDDQMKTWETMLPGDNFINGELHCYVCLVYRPAEEFYADRARSSGRSSKCKPCANMIREMRR